MGTFCSDINMTNKFPNLFSLWEKALKTVAPIIGEAIHYYKQNSTGQTTGQTTY